MTKQTGPSQVPPGFEDVPYAELTADEQAGIDQIAADYERAATADAVHRFDTTGELDAYLDSLGSADPERTTETWRAAGDQDFLLVGVSHRSEDKVKIPVPPIPSEGRRPSISASTLTLRSTAREITEATDGFAAVATRSGRSSRQTTPAAPRPGRR